MKGMYDIVVYYIIQEKNEKENFSFSTCSCYDI